MGGENNKGGADIYGDIDNQPTEGSPAIPAATVVLLRDGDNGPETLMLHRTSTVHFGGMWVFPGGRIEEADFEGDGDRDRAARNAAARETLEETGMAVSPGEFVYFSHWTPPASTPRRYATWFFATELDDDQLISVDGHEIQDHQWISPRDMMARHALGEVDIAPPTWITLNHLAMYDSVASLLDKLSSDPPRIYVTRIARRADGARVTMWTGDAGYDTGDADVLGTRHRLVMSEGGFVFENTEDDYV